MAQELVSIVIATYNEQDNIEPLLKSCATQTYQPIEIIVVDSERTSDNTSDIARGYTKSVFEYGRERSQQRNYGCSKAKGKYLLVLDADMQLDSSVVSDCVAVYNSQSLSSVVIPEKSYGHGYWANCKALERNCYLGDPTIEAPRFFKKIDFIRLGGYDLAMVSGEDWDLGRRLRTIGPVGRITSFIYHNEGKINLLKTIQKKYYYSRMSTPYLKSNLNGPKDLLLFIFRPAYFRNWRTLLSDPLHFPGFVLMKSLELLVGGLSLITNPTFWQKLVHPSRHA